MNNLIYNCESFGIFVYENKDIIGSYPIKNFREMTPTSLHYEYVSKYKEEVAYWSTKTGTKISFIEKGRPFILLEKIGAKDPEDMKLMEKWLISYNEDKFGWIGVNAWLNRYINVYNEQITGE